jgi:hypothetical protein
MFDTQSSAREKTPFGDFELHKTHLTTGVTRIGYQEETIDAGIAWQAALKVCSESEDPQGRDWRTDPAPYVEDARLLLDMLGLTEVRRG